MRPTAKNGTDEVERPWIGGELGITHVGGEDGSSKPVGAVAACWLVEVCGKCLELCHVERLDGDPARLPQRVRSGVEGTFARWRWNWLVPNILSRVRVISPSVFLSFL